MHGWKRQLKPVERFGMVPFVSQLFRRPSFRLAGLVLIVIDEADLQKCHIFGISEAGEPKVSA
jgi:hypothetical protein